MSLTLAILLNVLADIGIVGALAYVMTRPVHLEAHRATDALPASVLSMPSREQRADWAIAA